MPEALRSDGLRSVVVLADPAHEDRVRQWRDSFTGDDVTVMYVGVDVVDVADVVERLTRRRGQDVILVVLGGAALARLAKDHRALFSRLFLELSQGGSYLVDRTVAGRRSVRSLTRLEAQRARRRDADGAADAGHDRPRWRRRAGTGVVPYIRSLNVDGDLVVVRKRGRHAWKVREDQVVEVLPRREAGARATILHALPPGRVSPEFGHVEYGPGPGERWPRPLAHPELALRHYEGELVSLGAMRLVTGRTVLPETFRHPQSPVLIHPALKSVTRDVVSLQRGVPERVLDGDFYFLDCLFSGQFGHLTTEVVSRLWGWEQARRELPGLLVLFHTNPAGGRDGSLERRLFAAYGIPDSDLVGSPGPVGLRSVVGASPMWHNHKPYYVHPEIPDTWARITRGLLGSAEPSPHERIFVSRGSAFSHRRRCRNQPEVERLFAERGFHVFCPEDHSLAEQAALFAGARVVAGFGGSAMGNLMHARRLEALVVLSHNAYTGRSEHLFASVWGADLHYFWQQSDVAAPRVGRSKESDRSSFAVDLAGQGVDLRRVIGAV